MNDARNFGGLRMRHTIILLASLAYAGPALAAQWEFVANCGEQGQVRAYSYDRASIRRDRGRVVVNLRGDYSQVAASRVKEARLKWSFDCASETFVEHARKEFGLNREVVANYRKPTGAMGITEGSIASKVRARICG